MDRFVVRKRTVLRPPDHAKTTAKASVLEQARYDPESIRILFDDMASTYGRINLISSFGFTARWRHQAVAGMSLATVDCVIDLMSGM
jgi:hypothetical protein